MPKKTVQPFVGCLELAQETSFGRPELSKFTRFGFDDFFLFLLISKQTLTESWWRASMSSLPTYQAVVEELEDKYKFDSPWMFDTKALIDKAIDHVKSGEPYVMATEDGRLALGVNMDGKDLRAHIRKLDQAAGLVY